MKTTYSAKKIVVQQLSLLNISWQTKVRRLIFSQKKFQFQTLEKKQGPNGTRNPDHRVESNRIASRPREKDKEVRESRSEYCEQSYLREKK